jgi:Protein phosphatase 2C
MIWRPRCSVLQVVKAGNEPGQVDDAADFRMPAAKMPLRAAVADGATEAMLSGLWARCLVKAACRAPSVWPPDILLESAREYWRRSRNDYVAGRERRRPLKWYEETGLANGSQAALCWIECRSSLFARKGSYMVAGVGDVCLFHTRRGRLLDSFPVTDAAMFSNRPPLLSTDEESAPPAFNVKRGVWRSGDTFILASDALAAWLLAHAADRAAWTRIADTRSKASFSEFVAAARERDGLRNDDVTLLLIEP